jgi:hypothetical protein
MKPGGVGPHYVVDFNGTIYVIVDERKVAWHAGWGKERGSIFKTAAWRAPAWWLAAWGKYGFTSPLQLLPAGTSDPNSASIGIELLITTGRQYTDEQYRALALLIVDIEKRHNLAIPSAPGLKLVGHEDYAPHKRQDSGGGWDPGAHRKNPFFSWSKLWSYMRGSGAATAVPVVAPAAKPSPAAFTPPADPQAFRRFRLTTYLVADQRELPTGAVVVPIYDNSGTKLAEGSPAFFAQLSLEGSARLTDGRLLNVSGKKVPVSHADYAGVLAYHRQAYANREKKLGKPTPTLYSGIVVSDGRVTQALAFHEVPPAKRGIGYGMLRGIALVPFRTLAADIGLMQKSDPRWKGKGGLVPPATRVYIKEYVGVRLPDGTTHDGWFVVNDTGGAIFGAHFDVFVGSRALSKQVTLPAFGQVWFAGIEQRIPAGYSYGLQP